MDPINIHLKNSVHPEYVKNLICASLTNAVYSHLQFQYPDANELTPEQFDSAIDQVLTVWNKIEEKVKLVPVEQSYNDDEKS